MLPAGMSGAAFVAVVTVQRGDNLAFEGEHGLHFAAGREPDVIKRIEIGGACQRNDERRPNLLKRKCGVASRDLLGERADCARLHGVGIHPRGRDAELVAQHVEDRLGRHESQFEEDLSQPRSVFFWRAIAVEAARPSAARVRGASRRALTRSGGRTRVSDPPRRSSGLNRRSRRQPGCRGRIGRACPARPVDGHSGVDGSNWQATSESSRFWRNCARAVPLTLRATPLAVVQWDQVMRSTATISLVLHALPSMLPGSRHHAL